MILDTTVLVDLQRELRRERPGHAVALLAQARDASIFISFVTLMEFAEGFGDDERSRCERFLSPFQVLWPDADTAWHAARLSRALAAEGTPIGDHDLWIAALALQHGRAVVSRNQRHFRRVPGLALRTY
jgi:predicted nucleic acid-binding protein